MSENQPHSATPEDIDRALAVEKETLAASTDRMLSARNVRIERARPNLSRAVNRLLGFSMSKGDSSASSSENPPRDQDDQSSQNMS